MDSTIRKKNFLFFGSALTIMPEDDSVNFVRPGVVSPGDEVPGG